MLHWLLRVYTTERSCRLLIIYLSMLLRSSRTTYVRAPECCCCRRLLCNTRVNCPCVKCIRIKETEQRCQETKWQKLCELPSSIRCATTPNCVLPSWIMDGKDDCGDGSDEVPCKLVPCPTPETSSITQTTTKRRTKTTTPTTTVTSTTTTATLSPVTRPAAIPFSCDKGQFRCESGECINGQLVLDGKQDCFDNSDEEYCKKHEKDCPADLPCSYYPDIGAFGCGCPPNVPRDPKGVCGLVRSY